MQAHGDTADRRSRRQCTDVAVDTPSICVPSAEGRPEMGSFHVQCRTGDHLATAAAVDILLSCLPLQKVLLLDPDFARCHGQSLCPDRDRTGAESSTQLPRSAVRLHGPLHSALFPRCATRKTINPPSCSVVGHLTGSVSHGQLQEAAAGRCLLQPLGHSWSNDPGERDSVFPPSQTCSCRGCAFCEPCDI